MGGDDLPLPPPSPPPPGKPLNAEADFLTPGNGVSSTAAEKTLPTTPEETIMDAVISDDGVAATEVIGEMGGEA